MFGFPLIKILPLDDSDPFITRDSVSQLASARLFHDNHGYSGESRYSV